MASQPTSTADDPVAESPHDSGQPRRITPQSTGLHDELRLAVFLVQSGFEVTQVAANLGLRPELVRTSVAEWHPHT